jgi:hypothetical protein
MNKANTIPVHVGVFIAIAGLLTVVTEPVSGQQRFAGLDRVADKPFSGQFNIIDYTSDPRGEETALVPMPKPVRYLRLRGSKAPRIPSVWVDIRPIVESVWSTARPILIEEAMKFLNERDIGGGFRTSRNVVQLAEQGELMVGIGYQNVITLAYAMKGNSLKTELRVPGPTPDGWDPKFHINFNFTFLVDIETKDANLSAGPARVNISADPPSGGNVTGDLALVVNNLFGLITGVDFVGVGVKAINDAGANVKIADPVKLGIGNMPGVNVSGVQIIPTYYLETSPLQVRLSLAKVEPFRGPR